MNLMEPSPAFRPNSKWLLVCLLPLLLILYLPMLVRATPAFADVTLFTSNKWDGNGYSTGDAWGYDVNHAFSSQSSNIKIWIYEDGLTVGQTYQVAIYDSTGAYVTYIGPNTQPDTTPIVGNGCTVGSFLLVDTIFNLATVTVGKPWHIAAYPLSFGTNFKGTTYTNSNALGSTPLYVNACGTAGGGSGNGTIGITTSSLAAGTVGASYSQPLTATGGYGSYTWSASGLPGGLSINSSTGTITGTPTTDIGSPFNIQVTVRDAAGNSVEKTYAVAVAPVAPTGVSLSMTSDGIAVGATDTLIATVSPAGADQAVTWSSDNSGCTSVDQTGEITGVTAGMADITATTNGGSYTATCFVIIVEPISATLGSDNETVTVETPSSGLNSNAVYWLRYYDNSGAIVESQCYADVQYFSSQLLLSNQSCFVPGTWTVKLYDNNGHVVSNVASFQVTDAEIPEFSGPIALLPVVGACAAIYVWMRKRRRKATA
jgi:hypothetical protein